MNTREKQESTLLSLLTLKRLLSNYAFKCVVEAGNAKLIYKAKGRQLEIFEDGEAIRLIETTNGEWFYTVDFWWDQAHINIAVSCDDHEAFRRRFARFAHESYGSFLSTLASVARDVNFPFTKVFVVESNYRFHVKEIAKALARVFRYYA